MNELLFRQAIFHSVTEEFLKWHYWGLIDKVFVGIDTGWVSPSKAVENSQRFTGLTDKKGIRIYEGDLIRAISPIYKDWEQDIPHKVEWMDRGCWILQRYGICSVLGDCIQELELEVIGNIWESPEFLEVKDEIN